MGGRSAARSDVERPGRRKGAAEESAADAVDPDSVARTICLRLLTRAPRTRAQLADALRRRAVPEDAAERVLDRLVDVRLIDDGAFADAWVDTRHRGRGLARRALRAELRQRGVDDELVGSAVARIGDDDEAATAAALVSRRLPSTRGLPYDVRVRRLAGMLARRGYSGGLALGVIRDALRRERENGVEGGMGVDGWEGLADAASDEEPL